jgi:GNAT superfamily N-acetyltransferase/ribosomal protein S27AE
MDIRPAEPDDRHRVREIASDSFRSSYSLSPQQIETILEDVFSEDALTDRIEDPDVLFLLAGHTGEEDGVYGFIDVAAGTEGTIRWLHVDPDARGEGIATALFERVQEELRDSGGTSLTARVLADAVEGGEFCERFGLERSGNSETRFGDEEYHVALFTEGSGTEDSNDPSVTVPETLSVDGTERPLDADAPIPGADAPFFPVYSEEGSDEQYGYFCSECGSTDVSADGLDRLECGECGNEHRADEWDGAYL